jgi:predicted glycoside hydrolase/deacetylase ChbG (UPF0249 family)
VVIAITSETHDMQDELNLVWKHLLPAFKPGKLAPDARAQKELRTRLAALALPNDKGIANEDLEKSISGKEYAIVSADRMLRAFRFDFNGGLCRLTCTTDSLIHDFEFGAGRWVSGETAKFGPALTARQKANRLGLPLFKIEGSYRWKDAANLELTLRYIESPHKETLRFSFGDPYATLEIVSSIPGSLSFRPYKAFEKPLRVNPPRLIVRGDDMGFSHSANAALITSYREGIETSIEVIVPSPWFPEAVRMLRENPRVDVGLHFAITSEWDNVKWRPLTEVPSLQNADGYFYPMLFPNKNYPKQSVMENAWKIEDVEKEMRAQIELARKHIPRLSHVSGHMGSTMSAFSPEVKALAERISKEYNLPFVDLGPGSSDINYVGLDLRSKTLEEQTQAFIDMLNKLEEGKTYVYVEHPGLDDPELRAIYHLGYEDVAQGRQDVTSVFTSEKVKEAIVRKGIQLVSYKEVLAR